VVDVELDNEIFCNIMPRLPWAALNKFSRVFYHN
jgi:hypothetical protein